MTTQQHSGIRVTTLGQPAAERGLPNVDPFGAIRRARPTVTLAALVAALIGFGRFGTELGISAWDTYRGLLFIHVAVALVALGSTFALPILQPMAARNGVATLRLALRFAELLESRIVTPGSILVIASGIGLTLTDVTGYRFDLPAWLVISMVWVALVTVIATTIEGPTLHKAVAIVENVPDEGPLPHELEPVAARLKLTGQVLSLSTIGILFLMAWKPEF